MFEVKKMEGDKNKLRRGKREEENRKVGKSEEVIGKVKMGK